jgi:hypothetical protein
MIAAKPIAPAVPKPRNRPTKRCGKGERRRGKAQSDACRRAEQKARKQDRQNSEAVNQSSRAGLTNHGPQAVEGDDERGVGARHAAEPQQGRRPQRYQRQYAEAHEERDPQQQRAGEAPLGEQMPYRRTRQSLFVDYKTRVGAQVGEPKTGTDATHRIGILAAGE